MEGDPFALVFLAVQRISIHSLRMEGDDGWEYVIQHINISIHSLRMEGDNPILFSSQQKKKFQSTPSAWRETAIR